MFHEFATAVTNEKSKTKLTQNEKSTFDIWEESVPKLSNSMASVVFVMCLLFAGVGTIFAGLITKERRKSFITIVVGFLQIVTVALCGIGWLWAVLWGVFMVLKSNPKI
ncbi:hypothetical protein ABK040_002979 [Willaertia magna]